jgi:hypothetical protein
MIRCLTGQQRRHREQVLVAVFLSTAARYAKLGLLSMPPHGDKSGGRADDTHDCGEKGKPKLRNPPGLFVKISVLDLFDSGFHQIAACGVQISTDSIEMVWENPKVLVLMIRQTCIDLDGRANQRVALKDFEISIRFYNCFLVGVLKVLKIINSLMMAINSSSLYFRISSSEMNGFMSTFVPSSGTGRHRFAKLKSVLPEIQPAKLAKCLAAFDDADGLFELKHDGFRSLAYVEEGHCRLVSRRRNTYKSFEVLREALSGLRAQSAILDGEIVALDSGGASQFKELLYRRGRAVFFAFDLVWLDGVDLRQTPLVERKKKLRRLIERSECSEIMYSQHVERDGKLLFQVICERNLEGIVCKRKTSVYSEHGWLKVRTRY